MPAKLKRETVDLSNYPDMVVIYLGMRVNSWRGLKTLMGIGPKIAQSVADEPEGLLLHESIMYGLFPPHVGMRQYWTSFEALESWARSDPHKAWWGEYLKDTGGTGFWHEAYFMRGGMEAVWVDMQIENGFLKFAPQLEARGRMFSARDRAKQSGDAGLEPPMPEDRIYTND